MNLIDFNKDVFSVTDVGLVRQANEDNCYAAETPNGFLFVVCDGMGGHVGGAKASAIAVNSMVNFFTKERYAVIHQAMEDALGYANKQILQTANENPELKGMGTTACVLLIRDDKAWFAHIGDSRIYLFCNKQQQLCRLTKDHSIVQGLVDQGIITEAEAEGHPNRNRILKTLGIQKTIQPDVCTMPVLPAKGDVFLVCSDGLTSMVNDEIIQHILTQKTPLTEKGENMLTFAKQAGGKDNITIQLIQVSNSPHAQSVFECKNSLPSRNGNSKKSNKRGIMLIAAIVVLLIAATAGVFLWLHPATEKIETNVTQTDDIQVYEEPEWKKAVERLGFQSEPIAKIDGKRIFSTKRGVYHQDILALWVAENDSYEVGTIIISDAEEMKFTTVGIVKKYNKDGKQIQ